MTTTFNQAHNVGVRRAINLAKQVAVFIETEAASGTERDGILTEALRAFAAEAEALLLPTPSPAAESDEID